MFAFSFLWSELRGFFLLIISNNQVFFLLENEVYLFILFSLIYKICISSWCAIWCFNTCLHCVMCDSGRASVAPQTSIISLWLEHSKWFLLIFANVQYIIITYSHPTVEQNARTSLAHLIITWLSHFNVPHNPVPSFWPLLAVIPLSTSMFFRIHVLMRSVWYFFSVPRLFQLM